jgi:quinol monooxygenase YgiN
MNAASNATFIQREPKLPGQTVVVILEEVVLASRSDPGVVIYDLHCSADASSWFLYERYESQEHLDRHRENPVLRGFLADAAILLDGKLDVRNVQSDCKFARRLARWRGVSQKHL